MALRHVVVIILTFITSLTAESSNTAVASLINAAATVSPTTAFYFTTTANVITSADTSPSDLPVNTPPGTTTSTADACFVAVGDNETLWELYLNNKTEEQHEVIWHAQLITLGTFVASTTICVIAFGFVWASLFLIHFKIRRLQSMNEKIVFAEELLSQRKIPQSLLSRLGRRAQFDEKQNERENENLLKSLSHKKAPKS